MPLRAEVCAIEWDGNQFLGVTIDIYTYVFVVEDFDPFDLTLFRSYQHWQDGWCRPDDLNFERRPDLVKLAMLRSKEHWDLCTIASGHSPEKRSAFKLFYDPSHDVFDRRADIATLVAGIAHALDMNAHLKRRPA